MHRNTINALHRLAVDVRGVHDSLGLGGVAARKHRKAALVDIDRRIEAIAEILTIEDRRELYTELDRVDRLHETQLDEVEEVAFVETYHGIDEPIMREDLS
jgi:hypothetical protein